MKRRGNISYMLFLAVTAAVGGLLFGYDTAVIFGTVELVTARFGLDSLQQGWYVGCALAGSIAGVLCAGVLSDRLGRRRTMLVSAVLFTVSAAGCALCADFTQLVVYRIVGGLGIGVVSVVSPLYISEVSAARRRGMLVSFYQLAVTMGFLAAYTVNYLLLRMGQTAGFETAWVQRIFVDEVWRGMLGAETLPALLFFVIIFFIPESPRWLALRGRTDRALRVLGRINGDRAEAAAELAAIETAVGGGQTPQWRLLLSKGIRTAVLVGTAIAILGQFMGVNAVLYYGPSIFERAGWSGSDSLFAQILVGAVNMLTTVLALAIIDRVGRKKLVYWGVSGMVLSLLLIGTCFLTGEAARTAGRRAAGGVPVLCFLLRHLRLRRGMGAFVGDVSDSCARRGDVDRGVLALDGDLSGRAAYAVDARESDAGGDFFPLRRDVRALYAADMEGGAGDVGPHARRDRTILDKVTI